MECARCRHEVPPDAAFCPQCGARLVAACSACGTDNAPSHRFCTKCGTPLTGARPPERDPARGPERPSAAEPEREAPRFASPRSYTPKHLADKILVTKSALEGERKQVTVLFCDITDSTGLAERLGAEAMHDLLDRFFELALAEVHRYEGTVNQFLGDGFMALFGAPLAHEDDARRAVLAALGIQRRLEAHASLGPGSPQTVRVRMGINTGFVVVGRIGDNLRMDYTAVGDTTNLAARLQQAAEPGQVLLSDATHRLVSGVARAERIDALPVKGRSEPVTAWRLTGLGPRRSSLEERPARELGEFVGRQREVGVLHDLFAQVLAGEGQVVGVVGEPGMGKSRLLHEFGAGLAGQRVTLLEGRCVSYGSSIPYLPLVDLLRHNCGIVESDGADAVVAKVNDGLRGVGLAPTEWARYVLHLLGVREGGDGLDALSPEAIKSRTFEALRQLALRGSRLRPIVFVVEDLHWIDRTSEDYLASLVESLTATHILLLMTYRPGYRPPWMDRSYATQITLRPLGRQDALTVVRSIVSEAPLSSTLSETILGRAEGNPFFLEELALSVAGQRGAEQAIPDTVQGVITARIDRLSEETKRLLRTASVLGREFSLKLLDRIWDGGDALQPHLLELKRLEFVYERAGGEEPVYVFKHALTQDVAYDGLLTPRRQALHGAGARALEELFADRLEEVYGALAFHYGRSEDADKAVEYLLRMADKAARVYANAEALVHLADALVHLERRPRGGEHDRIVIEIALRQGFSLYFLGRFEESVDLLLRHQEPLAALDDPDLAGRFHFWLAHMYSRLGKQDLAASNAHRAIEKATRAGDDATLGKAHGLLALEGHWAGRPAEGVEHGREAVALLEKTNQQWWLGMAHFYVAVNHLTVGRFDDVMRATARARAVGESISDPRLQCYALFTAGWADTMRGELDAASEESEQARKLAPDPVSGAYAASFAGYTLVERGESAEAIPLLELATKELERFRFPQWHGKFLAALGEAYRLEGDLARARDVAERGLAIVRSAQYWFGVGYAERILARIARAGGDLAAAESRLGEALRTFASIGAEFEIARVHLELADLVRARDVAAAREHLDHACRTFAALRTPRYTERAALLAATLSDPR